MKSRRRGRDVLRVALLLALFSIVILAVDRFVPGARHRLSQASPGWLAIGLALEIGACISYVLLFRTVFDRAPHPLPARRSTQIALGELGAFAIVPTGIGGPLLRFWALRAGGMPMRTLIVRSVSHAGIFNAPYVLSALVIGAGASLHLLPGHAPVFTALAPAGLVLAVCVIVAGAAALSRSTLLRPKRVWGARLRSAIAILPDGARDLAAVMRRHGWWVGSLGWWVGDCGALWAAFRATGGAPALSVLILAYMLGQLGNALPLPGGVGGVEPLMLGIFVASGVDAGLAAAAIVCYRALALGIQGLAGAVALTTLAPELRGWRVRADTTCPPG
ncbi:MAG: hypothetical protein NVS2B6_04240 [Thermoleophilaceae bacterium]